MEAFNVSNLSYFNDGDLDSMFVNSHFICRFVTYHYKFLWERNQMVKKPLLYDAYLNQIHELVLILTCIISF